MTLHGQVCASVAPPGPWHEVQLALVMQAGVGAGLDMVTVHLAPQGEEGGGRPDPQTQGKEGVRAGIGCF